MTDATTPQRENAHNFELRTYKMRKSRVTASQALAIDQYSNKFMVAEADSPLDIQSLTNCDTAVVEVGFGMGEATISLAQKQPEVGVLAIDVHTPGVGRLLSEIATHGLRNIRVFEGNALALLEKRIPDSSLDGLRLFFPDPWPKARHHKRRFVTPEHMSLVASKVRPGGFFHFATDWQNYADQAVEVLAQHPDWDLLSPGEGVPNAKPELRPRTRFEQRGIDEGRSITDLVAVRKAR